MAGLKSLDPSNIEAYLFFELTKQMTDGDAGWVNDVAGPVIDSDEEKETYAGVGAVPRMRKMNGKRAADDLLGLSVAITSETFEATLRVRRKEIRRDKTGQVQRRVGELIQNSEMHWEEMLIDDIKTNTKLGYDLKPLFSTTHKVGRSAVQSNSLTRAGGAVPDASMFEDAIWIATRALKEFTDDVSRPVNRGKNSLVLLIPPAFNKAAAGALKAEVILSGGQASTNVLVVAQNYTFRVVESADLGWTDKFALFYADGKSMIRQQEQDSFYVETKGPGSDYAFDNAAYEFGVMVDRGSGPGRWQSAVQLQFTA